MAFCILAPPTPPGCTEGVFSQVTGATFGAVYIQMVLVEGVESTRLPSAEAGVRRSMAAEDDCPGYDGQDDAGQTPQLGDRRHGVGCFRYEGATARGGQAAGGDGLHIAVGIVELDDVMVEERWRKKMPQSRMV